MQAQKEKRSLQKPFYKAERDLVPDDFITAENGYTEQETGYRKQDGRGK